MLQKSNFMPFALATLAIVSRLHLLLGRIQVRGYFLVFVQLFEKYGALIERYTALIEKVSPCIDGASQVRAKLPQMPRLAADRTFEGW